MITKFEKELLQEGLLNNKTLDLVNKIQKKSNKSLIDILIGDGYIEEDKIIQILVSKFNKKYIDLDEVNIDAKVVSRITKEVGKAYGLIPFEISNGKVLVAMSNPLDVTAVDYIKFVYKIDEEIYIAKRTQILNYIEKYFDKNQATEAVKIIKNSSGIQCDEKSSFKSSFDIITNAPAVKLTNSIISQAINEKASDIHFEPLKENVQVRYRVDGVLYKSTTIPIKAYELVCSRIKITSKMDISMQRLPQDGKMTFIHNDKSYDLRVSSLPTVYGEKIAIRILYTSELIVTLDELEKDTIDEFNLSDSLKYSQGMVLITGPTGSGKTTTLYAMLDKLNDMKRNITTIEDPVEYTLKGVNQVNVNEKFGFGFSDGLRSVLRQDPDVIMVGEIRDEKTAVIAVRAAITGHLVLSTLHTGEAVRAITRLIDMGVPPYLVAESLIAVSAQRLVRKICPYCKEPYILNDEERKNLNIEGNIYFGAGCKKCKNTGYLGRKAIYETIYIDKYHRKLIEKESNIDQIRNYSVQNGMITLKDKCAKLVEKGITTYDEFIRISY